MPPNSFGGGLVGAGEKGSCILEAALDTGSTYTIVPWKIAKKLGLLKENVKVACHDLPLQATISVLLGFDLLKGFSTRLNFKAGKEGELEITDP